MLLEVRARPPLFKNGYVVACEETREGVIVDPGDEVEDLLEVVAREQIRVNYILLTHAHFDHVAGVGRAKIALGAPVCLHAGDRALYENAARQGLMFGFQIHPPPPVDIFYDGGSGPFAFGRYAVTVHHTPGHCPGGVCLEIGRNGDQDRHLFVGDTLFAGSIGRTDLPGGDYETLLHSIKEVLFSFADEVEVHPGHGPATTIGAERRTNPFLIAGSS